MSTEIPRRTVLVVAGGVAAVAAVPVAWTVIDAAAPPAAGSSTLDVTLTVNGTVHRRTMEARVTLLDALREQLGLTGTKKGCDRGECGACTVIADGRRIKSCLTLAAMRNGSEITTVEGLADGDELHPVQAAFVEHDAFQCGFCTSGQIMSAVAVIEEGHTGSDEEIRDWMSGNLCRCGAYPGIVAAVREASR
jgi:xanthine dehydrogenase YagT iron-sulfur-binding subunit